MKRMKEMLETAEVANCGKLLLSSRVGIGHFP
jgi:hypothetical protein